jgi:hypothetical protein
MAAPDFMLMAALDCILSAAPDLTFIAAPDCWVSLPPLSRPSCRRNWPETSNPQASLPWV